MIIAGMTTITLASAPDQAGQEAAGIVAGLQSGAGGRLIYNQKTDRLEVRDDLGGLVDEILFYSSVRSVTANLFRLKFLSDFFAKAL